MNNPPQWKTALITPVLPVYKRSTITFDHGKGPYLYAEDGKRYLDFAAGIAVNSLGHVHPHVNKALKDQADKIWHISNVYANSGMEKLAQRVVENTFADSVFFCNSGTEAIECGIKMVRKYFDHIGQPDRYRIITFSNAFHGRTIAAISAAAKESLTKGYEPLLEGFDNVPFNDLEAVKAAITPQTAAVLLEPIQGEGGISVANPAFIQGVKQLCQEHGLLLFLDEVQCGVGRTGKLYAYDYLGVTPDIVASAKGIGNGFPLGMCLANEKVGQAMTQGSHGTTYGGNPLAMAVGNAVLDVILEKGFLDHVQHVGQYLHQKLEGLVKQFPETIKEVRGVGLILGLKVEPECREFAEILRRAGLLTVPAGDNVIRILPPLIIDESHCDEAVAILASVCTS
ncbi:MAG: aspartate aminotransferase family protein [Alphaproteobacteria bacterium]|nr:aspartate aminotransferase family protein [Alphaproteobacteria bacterium]